MKPRAKLLLLFVTLISVTLSGQPAVAADGTPAELLPDLTQNAPAGLRLAGAGNEWRLAFDSTIRNVGDGPFRIDGHGGGGANIPMTADQTVALDDGSTTTYDGVGELRYVSGFGHEHWHLMRLEAYELVSLADQSIVASDKKTGFCMVVGYANDLCLQNQPTATSLVEGMLPGQSDTYTAFVEYQELPMTPTTTPDGVYNLIHRANPDGVFKEKTLANNEGILRLDVKWPAAGGRPTITCPDRPKGACPGYNPPAPPPPPAEPPPAQPADPTPPTQPQPDPEAQDPQTEPQPVPVVQDDVAVADYLTKLTRAQANELAKRAIRSTSKRKAEALATACSRQSSSAFHCRVGWTQSRQRWRGTVLVSRLVRSSKVVSVYEVDVKNSKTGRRLRRSFEFRASSSLLGTGAPAIFSAP